MTSHVVNLDAIVAKLPKGYSIKVLETPTSDQYYATISNSGAGIYVSFTGATPQAAADGCYERYVAIWQRND